MYLPQLITRRIVQEALMLAQKSFDMRVLCSFSEENNTQTDPTYCREWIILLLRNYAKNRAFALKLSGALSSREGVESLVSTRPPDRILAVPLLTHTLIWKSHFCPKLFFWDSWFFAPKLIKSCHNTDLNIRAKNEAKKAKYLNFRANNEAKESKIFEYSC